MGRQKSILMSWRGSRERLGEIIGGVSGLCQGNLPRLMRMPQDAITTGRTGNGLNEGRMNQAISFQADIPDEFIDRIAERVIDKLRPMLVGVSRREDETIFDVKSLAAYLSTTEQWVRDKARTGEIPCFKSGKYWKFHKRQIDRLYQSRSLVPISTATFKGRS